MTDFELNGAPAHSRMGATTPLLEVLREEVGDLTAKPGCREGRCGACTVLLDDEPVPSCMVPVGHAEGRRVTTLEGLRGPDGQLHPVQQTFEELGAVQCGICTSGMVLTIKALLDEGRRLSRPQIQRELANNLCRCTGYTKILDAAEELLATAERTDG